MSSLCGPIRVVPLLTSSLSACFKSDSNPYYKIYSEIEIIDDKKSGLILRCFDTYNCIPEIVSYHEVVCQKFIIVDNKFPLYKEWEKHTILVNNIKVVK